MRTSPSTPGNDADPALLEIRDLAKSFGSTAALKGVDLVVGPGEIHGLIGPNGAGKSTLIKILDGVHEPDRGTVLTRRHGADGPGEIGVIHQNPGLIDTFTVRENYALSSGGLTRAGFVSRRRENEAAAEGLRKVGLDLDPDTPLTALGPGERALLAVARVLAREPGVILLDEVTAALTKKESDWLLESMRSLADRGAGVVVVSHRLQEIVEHCDRVTVLQDGKVSYSGPTPPLDELHALLESGHQHAFEFDPVASGGTATPVLTLRRAAGAGVGPVDLQVRRGEVVALVGSLSSRLYAVGHVAAGRGRLESGERELARTKASGKPSTAFVPEDRQDQGIFALLEVAENMTISGVRDYARAGWIGRRGELRDVQEMIGKLDVRPPDAFAKMGLLSGGNQQKVLLGRAALQEPDLYVLCEPTHGVDVTTRRAIYRFIDQVRHAGSACLIVTVDVDDAMAVADRIGLIEDGRVTTVWDRDSTTATELLRQLAS